MTAPSATQPPSLSPGFTLVLGGGAARGAAHLGVLTVLEEEGLRPERIVGASIGALVGAGWAAGHSAATLRERLDEIRWTSIVSLSFDLSLKSLLSVRPLAELLRDGLGLTTFAALGTPFHAVACDLVTGEAVTLSQGDVVEAVLASSALPALFPPVERDGRFLVDGGIVDNLPVEAARAAGAARVVACDLFAPLTSAAPPQNMIEVWQRSAYHLVRANQPRAEAIDVLIQPAIGAYSFSDLRYGDELFDHGRAAAREAVPAIRALLAPSGS